MVVIKEFEHGGHEVQIVDNGMDGVWPGIQAVVNNHVVTHHIFESGTEFYGPEWATSVIKSYIDTGEMEEVLWDIFIREQNGEDYSFEY